MFKKDYAVTVQSVEGKVKTEVRISQDMPYTLITATLDGDVANLSNEALIDMVKEDFYVTNYFNRAEKEYVEELRKQVAESDALLEEVQTAMFEGAEQLCDVLERLEKLEGGVANDDGEING